MASETSQSIGEQPASPQASPPSPIPQSPSQRTATQRTSADIRRCWVCMGDETDDTSDNTSWRSPCPCSLTAHEACLLEWIADKEAPASGSIARIVPINCPQCQAPIKIQRPRDLLVDYVEVLHRGARVLILPTAALAIAGCVYTGLLTYGVNTIAVVFGTREAELYLGRALKLRYPRGDITRAGLNLIPFFPQWRGLKSLPYFLYLPCIAPALVSLRTNFGDFGLPLLMPWASLYLVNAALLVSNACNTQVLQSTTSTSFKYFLPSLNRYRVWPPSPDLAFATLPFIRSFYYRLYKRAFGSLEKKWDLAVQRTPREGETAEQIAAAHEQEEEEEQAIFELEIVHDVQEHQIAAPDPAAVADNAVEEANHNPEEERNIPPAPADPEAEANNNGWRHNFEIRQDVSATLSAGTVMGALFYPAVSAAVGELLKLSLPSRFVDRGLSWRAKGILQEKWGRTLVGGCVFVVLKDAVGLYCKWKRARDFGSRRVLDFVGGKKKGDA